MSNVLQKAFYLSRPQVPACLESAPRDRVRRFRQGCGAALRTVSDAQASATLAADWRPPSLAAFYPAVATLTANVSSAAAKPAPLLRPAQSEPGASRAAARQQR